MQEKIGFRLDAYYKPREVSAILGVSHRWLNSLLQRGEIASIAIGRSGKHRRVLGADILRYLEDHKRGGTPKEVPADAHAG